MTHKIKFLLLLLSISCLSLHKPAHAKDEDCKIAGEMILCLAPYIGMSQGSDNDPKCVAAKEAYFAIKIFDPTFDPGATKAARWAFLEHCANKLGAQDAKIAWQENDKVGSSFDAP